MSINRRDAILGVTAAGAFGVAEWLRPRRELNLLGNGDLEKIVPRTFGRWSSSEGGDFVVPETPSSLASRLYAKQLMRVYVSGEKPPVMLVLAYGSSQSDALQLHRPEACYSAVGFAIRDRHLVDVSVALGVSIPSVALSAVSEERTEDIVYWTRLGEALPQTADRQREERLAAAMAGFVGDGVLVRASVARTTTTANFAFLQDFLRDLVVATSRPARAVLVGTERSTRIA
jgi:EpsI family protein